MSDKIIAGRYRIIREIGRGGRSIIYRAYDDRGNRDAVVKVLNPAMAGDAELAPSLRREAEIMERLRHPSILNFYDYIEEENFNGLVMEYVESYSLAQLLFVKSSYLNFKNSIRITCEAGKALSYVHQQGIIHRDIKPGNILCAKDHRVVIIDWDLAVAPGTVVTSPTGLTLGTPLYMSPEQLKGMPLDARSDLYSLGTVLYELLAGSSPFSGESLDNLLNKILYQAPPPLPPSRLSSAIEPVVLKALAKTPDERYANADAFTTALAEASKELDTLSESQAQRKSADP